MTMTLLEQARLAEIRMHLEKYKAMGYDVSTWNDNFFLMLLEKIGKGEKP